MGGRKGGGGCRSPVRAAVEWEGQEVWGGVGGGGGTEREREREREEREREREREMMSVGVYSCW